MSAKDAGSGADQETTHGYALEELRAQYHRAQLATAIEDFNLVMHKTWDSRIALVSVPLTGVPGDATDATPQADDVVLGSFLLTQELLDTLKAQAEGPWASAETLVQAATAASDGAVRQSFAQGALNDINASYYLSDIAFKPGAGLATMYDENRPINMAIGRMIASVGQANQDSHKMRPRVKELCASNNNAHWRVITKSAIKAGVKHLDITLSDFFEPIIHKKARTRRSTLHTEACSLFDRPAALAPDMRFDAVIATYGFDSVWLQDDIHLSNSNGRWYRTLYRTKVTDWHPRRAELIAALRHGQPLPHAVPADYDGIVSEHMLQPYDIRSSRYKTLLETYPRSSFNVPGGLVQYTLDCFKYQLKQHGIFVSFDMGNFDQINTLPPQAKSGVAARYQPGEYLLAKKILEKEHGLHVRLMGLREFVTHYLGADWRKKATAIEKHQIEEVSANGVMIVSRGSQVK